MRKTFLVNDKKKMFSIFEQLEKEAKLHPKKDFDAVVIDASLQGSQSSRFWIDGAEKPLVQAILMKNNLK